MADIWKEDLLEDLEIGEAKFGLAEEFLLKLKKKFGGRDKELVRIAKLRRIEQGGKTMEEFVQEFQRAARSSGYKGRVLVEEFKRRMSKTIRRKLMKAERPLTNIDQ